MLSSSPYVGLPIRTATTLSSASPFSTILRPPMGRASSRTSPRGIARSVRMQIAVAVRDARSLRDRDGRDRLTAARARHESVERRTAHGEALGAIDLQEAGVL